MWQHACGFLGPGFAKQRKNAAVHPGHGSLVRSIQRSLHFVSNCNPRVQEVLIGCDLGVNVRLERAP